MTIHTQQQEADTNRCIGPKHGQIGGSISDISITHSYKRILQQVHKYTQQDDERLTLCSVGYRRLEVLCQQVSPQKAATRKFKLMNLAFKQEERDMPSAKWPLQVSRSTQNKFLKAFAGKGLGCLMCREGKFCVDTPIKMAKNQPINLSCPEI